MANVDNPHGFLPVKSLQGAPWNGLARSIGVTDGADIFMFDSLITASGLALSPTTATDDDVMLGVAVGFGKNSTATGTMGGSKDGMMFDPDDLATGTRYYDDSDSIHTEWNVFYAPAIGMLFQVQSDGGETAQLLNGTAYDTTATTGNTTTGISKHEIDGDGTAGTGEGVVVLGVVRSPDNDPALDNAEYFIRFNRTVEDDLA